MLQTEPQVGHTIGHLIWEWNYKQANRQRRCWAQHAIVRGIIIIIITKQESRNKTRLQTRKDTDLSLVITMMLNLGQTWD